MSTISLTRGIKLTKEDALKIMDSKPSKTLQELLRFIESQGSTPSIENQLILNYLQK